MRVFDSKINEYIDKKVKITKRNNKQVISIPHDDIVEYIKIGNSYIKRITATRTVELI